MLLLFLEPGGFLSTKVILHVLPSAVFSFFSRVSDPTTMVIFTRNDTGFEREIEN